MLSRYDPTPSEDELSYQFTTDSGDKYTAYFTEFFLQNEQGEDIEVTSFGFERLKATQDGPPRFDAKIKATIQYLLLEFFKKNADNAILYICFPGDGMARNRKITFASWFNDLSNDFIKRDSYTKHAECNFYSSIIVSKNNPQKDNLINAFYHTLSYWMGE